MSSAFPLGEFRTRYTKPNSQIHFSEWLGASVEDSDALLDPVLRMSNSMLLESLGEEIDDPETESFLLFSQSIPSQNLGFVNSKATVLDLTIGGRDLSINQSPTILSSNRAGGTTGAGLCKTPFAGYIN